jgi:hypothetical protein
MSYVHPAFVEAQRKRWLRPDWQRWMRPYAQPPQTKTYAARLIDQRRLEEKRAEAAERDALHEDLQRLRWLVRDLKIDLAIRRLRLKYGYNPDQPRDELGKWTDTGGSTTEPTIQLAMSWESRRQAIFGQKDLFTEVGAGSGGSRAWLPSFSRPGPTSGVLQSPGKVDTPLISGRGGPASQMPQETPGFDRLTRTHVEGQAAALMRQQGISEGTLHINNPAICSNCVRLLPSMLPSGARLDVIMPNGTIKTFVGNAR